MLEQAELNALKTFAVAHGRPMESGIADTVGNMPTVHPCCRGFGIRSARAGWPQSGKPTLTACRPTPNATRRNFGNRTAIMVNVVAETCLGLIDHELDTGASRVVCQPCRRLDPMVSRQ